MTKKQFCKNLAVLGAALLAEGPGQRLNGLSDFVTLGLALLQEDESKLLVFVSEFVKRPNLLRWELLGRSAERRQKLDRAQRAQLDILGKHPDLFGPLRSRWDERLHTETISWALDPRTPNLRGRPLELFMRRIEALRKEQKERKEEGDSRELPFSTEKLGEITVRPEVSVPPYGRVDICVSTPELLLYVEAKVLSGEGESQLPNYLKAAKQYRGKRMSEVVFLTADPEQEPSVSVPHLTFRHLLADWLPIAVEGSSGEHEYLSSYLASVARLVGVGAPGDFDDWGFSARRGALDLLESSIVRTA